MAFHNYHDASGKLPPAVVYGKDGRPLYSRRVVILPYLEQKELYYAFHLDEPWDSPHNIQLLPRIPYAYIPPGSKKSIVPFGYTFCHVFVGKQTPFEDGKQPTLKAIQEADGTFSTFLVVEGSEAVPWTKPEDIPFDPKKPLPKLATVFKDGFRAAMMDGSSRFWRVDTPEEALRAAITWNGGEKVPLDW